MVTPPPAAVMVRVEVPAVAVEAAEIVNVLLPLPGEAMVAGEKLAVTPVGSPVIVNETAELKPGARAGGNVTGVEAPGVTLAPVVLEVRVKLEAGRTVRRKARVLVVPPPTAAKVNVDSPAAAAELTARVNLLLPVPGAAMLAGARLAVTPLGTPLKDK